jgi:signal transduction histidine kinase
MRRVGLAPRIFVALLAGAIPPIVAVLIAVRIGTAPGARPSDVLVLVGAVTLLSLAWVAVVAVTYGRAMREEVAELVNLAERGDAGPTEGDASYRRLASSLDDRNRQVAELATQVNSAPMGDEPRLVADHVVRAAQSVTRDATWTLAVLDSAGPELLPPGIYDGRDLDAQSPAPLADLHRWAAVAAAPDADHRAPVHADGPWGRFAVVPVSGDEQLRAVLLAPWEGRADPTSAELALLALIGQHAATAIDHALLYARVRAQAEAIDRMAEVQRDFLRGVSHDLQTPLTSIRALAAEVRSLAGTDPQAQADLDLIEHQADRLRRMVAQLLVVSRLEAGVVEPQPEVLNPRPLIERTWTALRAEGRELDFVTDGASQLVIADPDRLEQVLWAILDNAVKYSPPGTDVEVRMAESSGSGGQRATIAIRDNGSGMDAETIQRAFEQFYRAPQARRQVPDGSGVGLYAARGLVQAMGGSVSVASDLGVGTTITIELPAEPVAESGPEGG